MAGWALIAGGGNRCPLRRRNSEAGHENSDDDPTTISELARFVALGSRGIQLNPLLARRHLVPRLSLRCSYSNNQKFFSSIPFSPCVGEGPGEG
jgi:hypothetical protein